MRKEAKILKTILKAEYPKSNISVRFIACRNYVDSSDKMLVTMDGANFMDVRCTILHHTRNVSVYRHKDIVARGGMCDPYILNTESDRWISLDMCEFIELNIKE